MEKFVPLRVLAGLCLALAVGACATEGPNPRAANIAPPPPPPNPLQAQAPQQAPQQQMVQPQQMTPQQQQQQQQQQQRPQQQAAAQARGGSNAGAGLAMGGHLVSFKSMEAAEAGWQALVRRQPALQQLRPYFVPVMVRGEPWVRLVAGDFPDRDEVNRFCNWARAQQLYCAPMPLAGASLENPSSIMSGGGASNNSAPAAAARQRQPRPAAPPQSGLNDPLPVPAPAAAPTPVAAAPALVAPVPNANNTPAQPLAPPLPPRRQPGNPGLPQ
jgi:hypothetical protein